MLRSSVLWARAAFILARHNQHFVPQNTITDCGVACALTVLNMAGRNVDPVNVSERLDPDRAGTDLNALRAFFKDDQGIPARALGVRADKVSEIRGHAILHMSRAHYIVMLHASSQGVLCFDPSAGTVFYPQAEFEKLYSGFMVEIPPSGKAPALSGPRRGRRRLEPLALFLVGAATRVLEAALVLSLCLGLFLVANKASPSSIFAIIGVVAVCGIMLMAVRRVRLVGQDMWVRRSQGKLWRGLLRTLARGNDLNGFRNQRERDVAGRLRQSFVVALPRRAQFPPVLGSAAVMTVLLAFLSPVLSLLYLLAIVLVIAITLLDGISVCRRSVRKNEGKYTKLSRGRVFLHSKSASMLMGDAAKWTLIGTAGYGVLTGGVPTPVMMFWVLMGMQIIPTDFRAIPALAEAFAPKVPISPLLGTEASLREQKIVGDVPLKLGKAEGLVRIDGIAPLTQALQNPDLTIREQRLILADVVRNAIRALPENERKAIGVVRLFGPGQDVTEADFENIALADEVRRGPQLPAKRGRIKDDGRSDPVRRAMKSCGPNDFPVFWDVRNQMKLDELRKRVVHGPVKRAGHLSMSRLTVIKEEA